MVCSLSLLGGCMVCSLCRGGYRLRPTVYEFWQGQTDRLHDRLVFTRSQANPVDGTCDNSWSITRLAP